MSSGCGDQPGGEDHNSGGDDGDPACSRVHISDSELSSMSPAEVALRWRQQDKYVDHLERRLHLREGELGALKEAAEKAKVLHQESQQREKVLVRRLAAKEQEMQDYVCQVSEMKAAQAAPSASNLRAALLDPAVNGLLQLLRSELQTTRARLEDTQNELSAWKFTPDSNTGKRLMAKCRLLYQENEELGRVTSSGRVATLEGELALQRSFSEEVRKSQLELDSFLGDIDEDVEGMQSTIVFLQQELRKTKEQLTNLQKENAALKGGGGASSPSPLIKANGESVNANVVVSNNVIISSSEGDNVVNVVNVNKEEDRTRTCNNNAVGHNDGGNSSPPQSCNKRIRRSSVLSLDYNEDDVDMDDSCENTAPQGANSAPSANNNKITNGDVQMSSSDVE